MHIIDFEDQSTPYWVQFGQPPHSMYYRVVEVVPLRYRSENCVTIICDIVATIFELGPKSVEMSGINRRIDIGWQKAEKCQIVSSPDKVHLEHFVKYIFEVE